MSSRPVSRPRFPGPLLVSGGIYRPFQAVRLSSRSDFTKVMQRNGTKIEAKTCNYCVTNPFCVTKLPFDVIGITFFVKADKNDLV